MSEYYVFFVRSTLPQPNAAHLVHDVNTANGMANLDYPSLLIYLRQNRQSFNPSHWFFPFRPQTPSQELVDFYQIQNKLKVIPLAMPWPIGESNNKWTHPSTLICKYYFPRYIFPHTKILHTLDWNLVKTAVRAGIPVIYEREHDNNTRYDREIVCNPLFQVAVTVADSVRENMIGNGMPPEKIVKLHLSFNRSFLTRYPEEAQAWRKKLLSGDRQHLIVYSGGLHNFKGVDLLIEVARELPDLQFVFAGGTDAQLKAYNKLARDRQVDNVTFLGYIFHKSLPSLLQAADILAHPHRSGIAATFTSPLKFFEYLASGTPIVATEIPPLMEFKEADIVAGWCKPDDTHQFALSLKKALSTHPRKTEGYGQQIDFATNFSWEARMAKIMSYVRDDYQPAKTITPEQ
ncbi:MAG: glycosyltransferase [Cyanobacteria bacterium P01_E01_bin.42]